MEQAALFSPPHLVFLYLTKPVTIPPTICSLLKIYYDLSYTDVPFPIPYVALKSFSFYHISGGTKEINIY